MTRNAKDHSKAASCVRPGRVVESLTETSEDSTERPSANAVALAAFVFSSAHAHVLATAIVSVYPVCLADF